MGSSMPAASVYSGKCTPAGIYRYSYFLLLLRKENQTETDGEKTHANEINNVNIYTLTKITWSVVSKQ